jgi:peptidoglycan DL-endopeptidase LytE
MCAACAVVGLLATAAAAQETRPRLTTTTDARGSIRLENEPAIISLAPTEDLEPAELTAPTLRLSGLNLSLFTAIEERLGTPYRLGSEGPTRFDCSGFVWSVYQQAGIDFERGSARTFWNQFAPADDDEKFKFGTLVFFNHLGHIGIVADEHGFYHASTSKGVVYSPFNEYWTKRIVGFRRVPLTGFETNVAKVATETR